MALIADSHVYFTVGNQQRLRNLAQTNKMILTDEPDFALFLGDEGGVAAHRFDPPDFMNQERAIGRWEIWRRCFAPLLAAVPTYLVLGNHDELHDPAGLTRAAVKAGLTVLRNDAIQINRNGSSLVVAGIDWARSAVACARYVDRACGDGEDAHLLLAHNPKAFLRAADLGIPLTLSGHTHGGQIAMKKRPNANLALTHRRSAGQFQSNGSMLYVTSGVGAWFPLRVNCPAEIAMLTIRHQAP